eukprot:146610-Pelagomonas_calceolata.AAC.1
MLEWVHLVVAAALQLPIKQHHGCILLALFFPANRSCSGDIAHLSCTMTSLCNTSLQTTTFHLQVADIRSRVEAFSEAFAMPGFEVPRLTN